jgi:MSHA biogenesis protein MshP
MCPERGHQRGFSLIMGIFLIVVLGGIAVFIGRVVTLQQQESALDQEGAQAYQAARAGVEWGVYRAIRNAGCAATTTLVFPSGSELARLNYSVVVTCSQTAPVEDTSVVHVYQITSTAQNATGGNFHVERQLQVTVAK